MVRRAPIALREIARGRCALTQPGRIVADMNTTLSIRITVRGRLSQRLATAFDGMTLVRCAGATDLVGEVSDQAQLHGLLSRIRDLGLELESLAVSGTDIVPPDEED